MQKEPDFTQAMSHHCFMVWSRYDPKSLEEHVRLHGKIRVRVPAPRQIWPEPTIG